MALHASRGFRIVLVCSRLLSISAAHRDWEKQGKFLTKMLRERVERKIQDKPKASPTFKLLDKKRSAVLSNLYMQNVTQALSFGGFTELADKGLQITHVAVKNTGIVEVFWTASENEDPVQIQDILSRIAGQVRNHLMYASMMGNVPSIVFKRDLTDIFLHETLEGLNKISRELQALEKNIPMESVEEIQETAPAAPLMRMDTLGLPHDKIYRRIKEAKKNSYPLQPPVPPTIEEFNESLQNYTESHKQSPEDQIMQKKELRKFIAMYQKSPLNSSTRINNCRDRSNVFYYEDDEDDYEEEVEEEEEEEERI